MPLDGLKVKSLVVAAREGLGQAVGHHDHGFLQEIDPFAASAGQRAVHRPDQVRVRRVAQAQVLLQLGQQLLQPAADRGVGRVDVDLVSLQVDADAQQLFENRQVVVVSPEQLLDALRILQGNGQVFPHTYRKNLLPAGDRVNPG